MRIVSYVFLLFIAVFGMTFAALNSTDVTVNYYFSESTLPISLLIVLVFTIGAIIGMATALFLLVRSKMQVRTIKHKLDVAEREIQNLRTMPLQDNV